MSSPVWHPFTQHAVQPDAIEIARGDGAWLETRDGARLLDLISSWWVVTHGHRHPRIVQAIKDQADQLDQVIFAGFTHRPAEELATRLLARVGGDLAHVFYSDSGSTAVEVALKMALGFWRNKAERRTRIVALEHAYHGDTIGTMSAGARGVFNAAYEPLLFDVVRLPFPHAGREDVTLDALRDACRGGDVAALIVEPLLLGAGGMLTYRAQTLRDMQAICRESGALFIADEVMTGFGRTGSFTACEQAGVTPDIMCLAKGITGGSMPLAVTLSSKAIFDAHYSTDRSKTFFHSSSYTANPIACAAAVANLDVWDEEPVRQRIATLCQWQADFVAAFAQDARFANARTCGTIAAIDLVVADQGYLASIGPKLYDFFLSRGLLLRPLGNTIYLMPPYCITRDELALAYAAIADAADMIGAR
ncbi:MAG: adenosylmethionine--8-amino-7-oxononanoate aminotransferase BioA [Hyphomicrobiales bacterium]|nr:adenosylmethionine--8-amino-7-oxononanoate aminotransferase BioA [Hyphomicrobiales bacterium]